MTLPGLVAVVALSPLAPGAGDDLSAALTAHTTKRGLHLSALSASHPRAVDAAHKGSKGRPGREGREARDAAPVTERLAVMACPGNNPNLPLPADAACSLAVRTCPVIGQGPGPLMWIWERQLG